MTTGRGVAELHAKLETIVGKTSNTELSLLQPDGEYQLLFVGQLAALDVGWVASIASQPLTFYTFRVLELADDGELLNRFEVSWLSDPPPPTVLDSTPSSATVTWLTAQACGMDMTAFAGGHDGLVYQLEVAEGRAWKASRVARFPGLHSHPQHFKVMLQLRGGARGAQGRFSEVKVTDLRPATWYHFRLRVTYAHGGEEVSTRAAASTRRVLVSESYPHGAGAFRVRGPGDEVLCARRTSAPQGPRGTREVYRRSRRVAAEAHLG